MAKRPYPLVPHIVKLATEHPSPPPPVPPGLYTPFVDLSCVGWVEVDACASERRNLLKLNYASACDTVSKR